MNSNNSIRKNITEKADIVNIVSQYVKLEKRGNNYIGLCPFHDDKNPSMSVSPQKKVFKCFSCGVAGDVITFVSKIKNISISEAMKEVGETVGIKVAMSQKDILKQKNSKYYNVLSEAKNFYCFYLKNTIEGKKGIEYLVNRKLSSIDIEKFGIGLAGDNDILYKTLSEKKYLPLDMIEVGLVRGGDFYHDVFKNRIMFPLKDLEGNVIGFSGRRFLPESENESKYINTSETILFKKGDILYNYSDCIQDIKQSNNVYLFEGFMDVIAAVRASVKNSVASMGTALTQNQVNAIKKITRNVTLCYDSDGPGVNATIKAIYLLVSNGINVNVVVIPDGKDADEYIFNHGADKLNTCLTNNIVSSMEFLYNFEKKQVDFTNLNSIENFKKIIFKHLDLYKSNILSQKIITILSNDIDVNVDSLLADYSNKIRRTESIEDLVPEITEIKKDKSNKRYKYSLEKYEKSERKLLLASFNNRKKYYEIEGALNNKYFNEINRNILSKLYAYYNKYDSMNYEMFYTFLNENEKQMVISIINEETMPTDIEIKTLIKNLDDWPYTKYIGMLNNKDIKTIEELQSISECKRKTTIIKINKE